MKPFPGAAGETLGEDRQGQRKMERRAFARLPRGCAADGSNFNACRPNFADCESVPHLEETRRGRPVSTRLSTCGFVG